MIKPTIGRVVWIRRPENETDQPECGLVTYVHSDHCINVAAFDRNAMPFARTSVYLDQDDQPRPHNIETWAEWMPFQKGQAARAEQLEQAALAGASPPG